MNHHWYGRQYNTVVCVGWVATKLVISWPTLGILVESQTQRVNVSDKRSKLVFTTRAGITGSTHGMVLKEERRKA